MQFFAHLITGLVLGLVLFFIFKDRWVIIATAVGSILPDLIDKPVGILFFPDTLGYGRIYFHSLLVCILILGAGVFLYYRYRSAIVLCLGIGVLSHQVLDSMWLEYWNWLWPFYGPFRGSSSAEYLFYNILAELTNPTEWLFGLIVLLIGLLVIVVSVKKKE